MSKIIRYIAIADSDAISLISIFRHKNYYSLYCYYCVKYLTGSFPEVEEAISHADLHFQYNHNMVLIGDDAVIQVREIVNDKTKEVHFFKLLRITKLKAFYEGKEEAHGDIIQEVLQAKKVK
jgi:hypothetical protein